MHSNKSLPPVGIPVKVKMEDGTWLPIKRDHWLTNKDDELTFHLESWEIVTIKRENIEWIYP
jgi:hypothetical protein